MKGLKRVYGKVLEKTSDGITVKTRKKHPVYVPFEDLARENVSVFLWKGGEHGIAVGCTIDVIWWDGPAVYSALFGPDCTGHDKLPCPFGDDFSDEDIPF